MEENTAKQQEKEGGGSRPPKIGTCTALMSVCVCHVFLSLSSFSVSLSHRFCGTCHFTVSLFLYVFLYLPSDFCLTLSLTLPVSLYLFT